jgi:peptidoglycan hydrolase FlgJ
MQVDPSIYTEQSSLTQLKKGARENSPEAIKQVAKQFESLFVQMMLKSMRDTVPENELFGSNAGKMYQDMYDKQLSTTISNARGIGLANVIERQLGGTADDNLSVKNIQDYIASAEQKNQQSSQTINSATTLQKLAEQSPLKFASVAANLSGQQSTWQTPEAFVEDVWPHALRAADELGVDADVLLAQSALETGWGKYLPLKSDGSNSFNLFGIKADERWSGDKVEIVTQEYRHGVMQQEKAEFRSYDSVSDAVADYVEFIRGNERYQKALEHGYDADAYARELQNAGYATDPDYAKKINRVRGNDILQNRASELKNLHNVPLT